MNKLNISAFHAFTIKYSGISNRITTEIQVSDAYDPTSPPDSPYSHHKTTALWDTGATKSVVTRATVNALSLSSVGSTIVNHAGGSSQSNTYLVNILLPNNVGVAGVLVSECEDIAGNFGAIVGMDIICQGDLSLTNSNGQTWMTFRIPSIHAIDYVAEANKLTFSGIGRNDPCPCGKKDGSGKSVKFKRCHGLIIQ